MKHVPLAVLLSWWACAHGEILIPVEMQYGSPVATAVIGERKVRLIVDSGGYSLGLRPETVADLNLDRSAETVSTTDVHGATKESGSLAIPSIEIGGHEFSSLAAYEWQMPPQLANRTPKIDGTLGRDFLNRYVAVYDYDNLTITLLENRGLDASRCDGVEVALIGHPDNVIVTEANVDDGVVTALWDTGATHSFIKAHVAEERGFPLDPADGARGIYMSEQFSVAGSDLGPLDFVALPFVEPQGIDVYIGRNFFASHVVCVNAIEGWLRVRPNQ